MKKYLPVFLCLAASPALAWQESEDFRGLHIYEAAGEGVSLSIVCDPDGAMIPPENHLAITVQGENPSGDYRIATKDAAFEGILTNGTLVSSDGVPWDKIISVLQSGAEVDLSVNGSSFSLNTGDPFPVSCGSSEE